MVNYINKTFFYGFQPILTIIFFVIWLQFGAINSSLLAILTGTQCILVALLEWKFPARKSWILNKGEFAKDMFYQLGVNVLYGPFFVVLSTQFFIEYLGGALKAHQLSVWPTHFPLCIQVILALLTTEFFSYWNHRMQHRFLFLWRIHSLHHSPNKMGWTKQAINHPIEEFILTAISFIPAALMGAQALELEGAFLLYFMITIFAHSNLNLNHRYISWLFVTNVYHYRHHSPILKESLSNYGCALVIWDRIFGTFKGFKSCNEVGIENVKDLTLLKELTLPLRKTPLGSVANN